MSSFKDSGYLKDHAIKILDLYENTCRDLNHGGFFCMYGDNGDVVDNEPKDLVSTCRFILNFSYGILLTGEGRYKDFIRHGLESIEMIHRDPLYGGLFNKASKHTAEKTNKLAYAHAFYLLALSTAYLAGIKEVESKIPETFDLLEEKMWDTGSRLYFDEISGDFKQVHPYRGQNSNMHIVEALICAYEATENEKYINRAFDVANKIICELTKDSDGLVWEHYSEDWSIDWEYNKSANKYDLDNLIRPYGFSPGHQMCWARFLLSLEKYRPEEWQLRSAEDMFRKTMRYAWDDDKGGLNQAFDDEGKIVDDDRRFWTHAETISTAAHLALRTGNDDYWEEYTKVWEYADAHLVDKKYGGWFRILSREGKRLEKIKSPPPKTDYHVMSMCYEILRAQKYYKEIEKTKTDMGGLE